MIHLYEGNTNTIIESIILETLYYTVRIIYCYKPRTNTFKESFIIKTLMIHIYRGKNQNIYRKYHYRDSLLHC